MINYKLSSALWLAIISFNALADDTSREDREIQMADQAVFWSIAAAASDQGRAECSKSILSCSDDRGELGLTWLANKRSPASRKALVSLLSYKIDAGLSEEFNCYVLEKGQYIVDDLSRADPKELRKYCEQKFVKAKVAAPSLLHDVLVDSICSTEESVRNSIASLTKSINLNKKCTNDVF